MKAVRALLRRAAGCDCTVLLGGETGTGKGLCAELVHQNSSRRSGPLVVVDGTLLHDELAASQLFGHAKGAFTGASDARQGIVAGANEGTLFIDEIGETSPRIQAALLRLIDEKRFQRLGETVWRGVDCRLVCATRRSLGSMVRDGLFRDDLLWRIRCLEITLPPLRDRGDDLILLSEMMLRRVSPDETRKWSLSREAVDAMRAHPWPGNVRELKSRLQRAVVLAESDVLTPQTLGLPATGVHAGLALRTVERETILTALRRSGANQRLAALLLGIAESSLRSKIRKHRIDADDRTST